MKYQVLSITLDKGNPVHLRDPFEMSADDIKHLGSKVSEMFAELGLSVIGMHAIYRGDIEQQWEREPEKPNLFSANGEGDDLPKKRKRLIDEAVRLAELADRAKS